MTARTRFIAKEGILFRGTVIGAVVAVLFGFGSLRDGTLQAERWRTTVLALLCFVEWSVGAGWLIGSFLWSWRHQRDGHSSQHLR
jgi:hypothetical protein